jgi:hypothetical protein
MCGMLNKNEFVIFTGSEEDSSSASHSLDAEESGTVADLNRIEGSKDRKFISSGSSEISEAVIAVGG